MFDTIINLPHGIIYAILILFSGVVVGIIWGNKTAYRGMN